LEGKNVVVIGRSQVIGKPVSMMMLEENATVTICHSKTKDLKKTAQKADIIIAAIGKDRFISEEYLSEGQIVIDVGINFGNDGILHGDVNFESAEKIVKAITPVPGGVGNVTTALLFAHTVEASKRRKESEEKLQSTCT
jgi:methylenetetrahydrofolate dehydrogenase (NADP+)/methenyltetrahydrofolate cyclohydrolase